MTKRRERWVGFLTTVMALAGLLCLMGCPPPQVREIAAQYQEIGIIQLDTRLVPSEIHLVRGRPARLHITNIIDKTTRFTIRSLDIRAELRHAELTQITLAAAQLDQLDGEEFTCTETGNTGIFRVTRDAQPLQAITVGGASEVAMVMTDYLAAPRSIVVKKGVPLKLYVTKTKGEEEDDTLQIEAWGIEEDVEVGKVTEIEFTPGETGQVTFTGIVTPSSRGTIHVVD